MLGISSGRRDFLLAVFGIVSGLFLVVILRQRNQSRAESTVREDRSVLEIRIEPEPDASPGPFSDADKARIRRETIYLVGLVPIFVPLLVVMWWFPALFSLDLSSETSSEFREFALASLAGLLGGTAFAMKWLHHSVGLGPWSITNKKGWTDRRGHWRFFVPILSLIIAGAFYAVLKAQLIIITVADTDNPETFAVAFGFIVGYFSDRAAAKLTDVAYVLFGKTEEGPEEQ